MLYQKLLNALHKWFFLTLQTISLSMNYNYTHFIVKHTETYRNIIIAMNRSAGKGKSYSGTQTSNTEFQAFRHCSIVHFLTFDYFCTKI